MSDWPNQAPESLNAYYGVPDANRDGSSDRAWEDHNLTFLIPPYPMVLAWDTSQTVSRIRVNRKCKDSLARVLGAILAEYGQSGLKAHGLHRFGGCFNYRPMRGGHRLSVHAWGAAIDLDPAINAFGRPWDESKGMMPLKVIEMFEAEGWVSGARWSGASVDSQHMQAATL